MKSYSTLSEVKRTCREIASTDVDYRKYNELKKEADEAGPWEMVQEYDSISIYSNGYFYIIVWQAGNILKLYKLIH